MKYSIGQAAAECGVSVRTLRYYDQIDLVKPSEITGAGYRFYDDAALSLLQQVLFYRELEFPLEQIRQIMAHPDYDPRRTLKEHRQLLELRRAHLDGLLRLVDQTLEGNTMKSQNQNTPKTTLADIENAKRQYADEARRRWGGTDAWRESEAKAAARTPAEELSAAAEADAIFAAFAAERGQDPASAPVQALVARWQAYITQHHYRCTNEILAGLGEMYVGDERFTQNLDRFGSGTALLMRDAIREYCK